LTKHFFNRTSTVATNPGYRPSNQVSSSSPMSLSEPSLAENFRRLGGCSESNWPNWSTQPASWTTEPGFRARQQYRPPWSWKKKFRVEL